jgi:hypothetical protein
MDGADMGERATSLHSLDIEVSDYASFAAGMVSRG